MRSSDFLFQLIKSLTKGERRNFKLFARLQDGDKQYIRLFEAIDEQEEYDEKELLERFKDEKFIRQFSVAKNYLHNYILRTLHIFHKDSQTELQVLMHQIHILKGKNLFEQAYKHLRKAKLMAERHERFQELMQLLHTERELLMQMNKHNDFHILLADVKELELTTIKKAANLVDYHQLTDEVFILLKKSHTARKATDLYLFNEIWSNPLIADSSNAISVQAKMQRAVILIDCHQFCGNYSECEKYSEELISIYESNPSILSERALKYLNTISYLSVFQHLNGKREKSLETMIKLRDFPVDTDEEKILIFEKYYQFILGHAIATNDPQLGFEAIEEIEGNFKFIESKLRRSVKLTLYYLSAYYLLYNGNASAALKWTNHILNEPKSELRVDLQCSTRILNLMIHFELGNKDLIEYFVKSTTRFLSKKDQLLKLERSILHFFQQTVTAVDSNFILDILQKTKAQLEIILEDPFEKKATINLDILKWIDSKILGISMSNLELVSTNN